jgi:glycosyltransferase involved in cell wall biosynthesis
VKILHFSAGSLRGGAARGAYCLHQGLLDLGVNSCFISNGKNNSSQENLFNLNSGLFENIKFALLPRLGSLPKYLYLKRQPFLFNTGLEGVDITKLKQYRDADIIHLHWINGMVSMSALKKIKKPVVWTIRDMWPFTGGCHYSMGCSGYTDSCGGCPQLGSERAKDLSHFIFENKKNSLPPNVRPIGISRWITSCANNSPTFEGIPVNTIYNNIDTKAFFPVDKALARKKLALPADAKIVLVGAQSVTDFYKGFELFKQAVSYLPSEKLTIVAFGGSPISLDKTCTLKVVNLGFITSDEQLRYVYSAADVFVAPSRMDAFGKTIGESLACATPVVCFNASGPGEIVIHKRTGYKAAPYDSRDLANGINWILSQTEESRERMKSAGVERVNQHFHVEVVAKQYLNLYREMLDTDYTSDRLNADL